MRHILYLSTGLAILALGFGFVILVQEAFSYLPEWSFVALLGVALLFSIAYYIGRSLLDEDFRMWAEEEEVVDD